MPNLKRLIGDFRLASEMRIRPVDLYVINNYRQAGVVLVGDSFATSCPAAGTGTNKVLTDVERLCNIHIPRWFATDGMSAEKIKTYYDDPVKLACDSYSSSLAYYIRSLTVDTALRWHARRIGWFLLEAANGILGADLINLKPRRRQTGSLDSLRLGA